MKLAVESLGPSPLDPRAEQSYVPMRDGVRLATDVYLPEGPAGAKRLPAVLVRLPYDKNGRYTFMPLLADHVTSRGYAFVVQDVRGKFRSEGETVPFVHEAEDGYDTLDWMVRQSWSNEQVVMFGDSYYGFTQWAAVAGGHPALRAIVPRVTSADLAGMNWSGEGITALYGADYLAHYWVDGPIYDFAVDWSQRPLASAFDDAFAAIGARSRGLDLLLEHAVAGKALPDPFPGGHPFARLKIPVLHGVGWFDNLAPDSMRDYTALTDRSATASLQYLIADSTDHENYRLDDVPYSEQQYHDIDDAGIEKMIPLYLEPALAFFDAALAGDLGRVPRARWHLGHDGWQTSDAWPPRGARRVEFFLADASRANGDPADGGGRLWPRPDMAASAATWAHDPDDLVPSTVEDPFSFLFEHPDERLVEGHPDVLLFTSEPVEAPLDLTGPAEALLRVATTAPSMHLFVKLLDVAPDGAAHMLTRGQVAVVAPDAERAVRVDLNHLGYRLPPGHRLGLQIASSDFPLYLPHPGTAENPWLATRGVRNEQTLVTGGQGSSRLVVTVR